jgi:MFS-type transporter involved in bile tolerance (Atg22 family)
MQSSVVAALAAIMILMTIGFVYVWITTSPSRRNRKPPAH